MVDWEKIAAPDFWKAFRIPAFAFAVLVLLLILRDLNSSVEYQYIQQLANYAIGASVISYGHYLFHATWVNRKKDDDLPFWAQAIAMAFHIAWFFWLFTKTAS